MSRSCELSFAPENQINIPVKDGRKSPLNANAIGASFAKYEEHVNAIVGWLRTLDSLGDKSQQALGSESRELAELRDEVDWIFARFVRNVASLLRWRAEYSHNADLLVVAVGHAQGDGPDTLHLMSRYHKVDGEAERTDVSPAPESFPDAFAWDTYMRVSALADLAEKFPMHLRHGAAQMHGWPMIVSAHLNVQPEFERIREKLSVGSDYPLDVGPRKRRGTGTSLLNYLEPLIWQLHVTRKILIETEDTRSSEDFVQRLYGLWWEFPKASPTAEILTILKTLPSMPDLTRATAAKWSLNIIVPLIMVTDAGTPKSCTVAALRNIWRHRAVKNRKMFSSRLLSAVAGTLERFGRE